LTLSGIGKATAITVRDTSAQGHTQIKTTARYSHVSPGTLLNTADAAAGAAGMGMVV